MGQDSAVSILYHSNVQLMRGRKYLKSSITWLYCEKLFMSLLETVCRKKCVQYGTNISVAAMINRYNDVPRRLQFLFLFDIRNVI